MREKRVYLSLGSNLGEREKNLAQALEALEREHIAIEARSSIYETEPQDVADQPWFLNMVVRGRTKLFPLQLLATVKRIERKLGRPSGAGVRRGPRVVDIDILLFEETVMETPELTIPHPRMAQRRFVLEPLLEIEPEARHPSRRKTFVRYRNELRGQGVRRIAGE